MFQEYRCVLLVGGKDETKKVQFVTLIPETTICIQNLGRRVARPNYPHDDFDGGEYLFLTRLLENTVTLMIICDRYILNNINPFIASLVTAWSPSLQSLYIAGDLNPEEAEQVWQAIVHKETLTRVSWNFFRDATQRFSFLPLRHGKSETFFGSTLQWQPDATFSPDRTKHKKGKSLGLIAFNLAYMIKPCF